MVDIEKYISVLTDRLRSRFGERLVYVGLQGSYLRCEATDESDIDIMAVIEGLTVADMDAYRDIIRSMSCADKSCGFICSTEDLRCWNTAEIFHLLNSTGDRYGKLSDLVPSYTREDIRNFVKMSINNIYHELCHRYIHGKRENTVAALPGIYKGVSFVLQDKYYLANGVFPETKKELLSLLEGRDHEVLKRAMELKSGSVFDHEDSFLLLFTWCQEALASL